MFTLDPAPGSIDPGSILSWTAEQLRRIESEFKSLGKRQAYVPKWTTTGTAPVLGNGALVGAFVELGSFIVVSVGFSAGSTTTFGTGAWQFSLPRMPLPKLPNWYSAALAVDASTSIFYSLIARTITNQAYVQISPDGVASDVTATAPFTWANGDGIAFTIGYPLE